MEGTVLGSACMGERKRNEDLLLVGQFGPRLSFFDRQVLTWCNDDHGLVAVHLVKTAGMMGGRKWRRDDD